MLKTVVAVLVGAMSIATKRLGPSALIFAFVYAASKHPTIFGSPAEPTGLNWFTSSALAFALAIVVARSWLETVSVRCDRVALPSLYPFVLRRIFKNNLFNIHITQYAQDMLDIAKHLLVLAIVTIIVHTVLRGPSFVLPFALLMVLVAVWALPHLKLLSGDDQVSQNLNTDLVADVSIILAIIFAFAFLVSSKDLLQSSVSMLLMSRFVTSLKVIAKRSKSLQSFSA